MTFPQKLQQYRKREKLSQEELAHRLGVSRQSVSKWEQGLSFPETEKLIELSTLMQVPVDALLKEGELPCSQEKRPAVRHRWLISVLAVLLMAAVVAVLAMGGRLKTVTDDLTASSAELERLHGQLAEKEEAPPAAPQPAQPQEEPEEVPAQAPDGLGIPEPGFESKYLQDLQRWFFDFAREYRLDYMPRFAGTEGAPVDSGEYLYWAYAINLEHWGANAGTMTKEYVEETVQMYFGVLPGQHRSHPKSWDFNGETAVYTAWPGGLREKPFYLLNGLQVDGDSYTVDATCYMSPWLLSEEDDAAMKAKLLEGEDTDLTPVSRITVTFRLNYLSFHRPVFLSLEESFEPEPAE